MEQVVACKRSTARTVGRKRYRSDAGVHAAGCLLSARERSTEGARLWPGKCYISCQLLWMMLLLLLLLLPVSWAADGGLQYMPAEASCGWLPGSESPSLPHQPGRGGAGPLYLPCCARMIARSLGSTLASSMPGGREVTPQAPATGAPRPAGRQTGRHARVLARAVLSTACTDASNTMLHTLLHKRSHVPAHPHSPLFHPPGAFCWSNHSHSPCRWGPRMRLGSSSRPCHVSATLVSRSRP